jgi:hypothetical protein
LPANGLRLVEEQGFLLLCGAVGPLSQVAYFFPIIIENTTTATDSADYSATTQGLVYTLAGLYVLAFALLTLHFGVISYFYLRGVLQHVPHFYYALIFLQLLCIFRIVYLFAFPSGVWDDQQEANFVIFELPTFFYFTAFGLLLYHLFHSFKAVSVYSQSLPASVRFLPYAVVILLVLAWGLFVAVAIAVAIIDGQSTASACPGRVGSSSTSVNQQITNLSIAYQSIVITFALMLALGFALCIVFLLRTRINSIRQRVFFAALLSSVICALGFLARCVLFLIILSVDFTSTVYMFVTLFLTEVVVILLVSGCFASIHSNQISYSTASHRRKSSSTLTSGQGNFSSAIPDSIRSSGMIP